MADDQQACRYNSDPASDTVSDASMLPSAAPPAILRATDFAIPFVILILLLIPAIAFGIPDWQVRLLGTPAQAQIAVTADCGDFSLDPYGDTTEEIYTFHDRLGHSHVVSGHAVSCVASDDGATVQLWYLPGDPQTYITADEFIFLLVASIIWLVVTMLLLRYLLTTLGRHTVAARQSSQARRELRRVLLMTLSAGLALLLLGVPAARLIRTHTMIQAPPDHHLGETVQVGPWQVTVTRAEPAQADLVSGVSQGDICLVVAITLRNASKQSLDLGGDVLALTASAPAPDFPAAPAVPCLVDNSGNLEGSVGPGATLQGDITDEEPASQVEYLLGFNPDGDCSPYECQGGTFWHIAVSQPAPVTFHQPGDTVVVPGLWSVMVSAAQLPGITASSIPAPSASTCVRIEVTLHNISSQTVMFQADQFELSDSQGASIFAFSCDSPQDNDLLNTTIPPEGIVEGDLPLEIPSGEQQVRLTFESVAACNQYCPDPVIWSLPVLQPLPSSFSRVGQVVTSAGLWTVKVGSARLTLQGVFVPPSPGDTCLLIAVTVQNLGSGPTNLDSDVQFNLEDVLGNAITAIPCTLDTPSDMDGTLAPAASIHGVLAYEVPASEHTYLLTFQNRENCNDDCPTPLAWLLTV